MVGRDTLGSSSPLPPTPDQESRRTPGRWTQTVREVLAEAYEVHEVLGSGGFATVWRVTNRRLGRQEALKVLAAVHGEDADFVQRFLREARLAAGLVHPAIVRIYAFGATDGIFWYTMELIEGETLEAAMRAGRRFGTSEVVAVVTRVLDALATIHHAGIVHRDLKPANIMLDRVGRPFVMDFGVAKGDDIVGATRTGAVMGTPAYVAPEALRGLAVDGRADLFAVGVVAFEMVSGRLPYRESSTAQLLLVERLTSPPLALQQLCPEVPTALATVIMQALASDPGQRWPTAAAMAGDLAAALHDSAGGDQPPRKAPNSRRFAVFVALLLAVVAVGAGQLARSILPGTPAAADVAEPSRVVAPTTTAATVIPVAAQAPPTVDVTAEPGPAETRLEVQPVPATSEGEPGSETRRAPPQTPRPATAPTLLDAPALTMPSELVDRCGGLSVPLVLDVGADGKVLAARSLGARVVDEACRELAIATASGYKFAPARDQDEQPVRSRVSVAVTFERLTYEGPNKESS